MDTQKGEAPGAFFCGPRVEIEEGKAAVQKNKIFRNFLYKVVFRSGLGYNFLLDGNKKQCARMSYKVYGRNEMSEKIAVMTDSNSGITKEEAAQNGIYLLPMPVIIDGEIYYEGENMTDSYFYECLTSGKQVSTSQPSPGEVMAMWEEILSEGYEKIIHIPMSSGLSHTCEAAIGLSKKFEGKVFVADNRRISIPMRESVYEAKRWALQGMEAKQIQERLEARGKESIIYIAVDTLEYLKKGGRVTAAGAALGTVLNIKPILSIRGEKLDAFAKVRGMKKCVQRMLEAIREERNTRFGDAPAESLQLGIAGTALSGEEVEGWIAVMHQAFPDIPVYYNPLSVSIGCHVGPGALGFGLCKVDRSETSERQK